MLGLRLLLRPNDDDPERPRQPAFAILIASVVVWLFALIGFWLGVVYAFVGGSGTRFIAIWLAVSAVALLGAAVLIPRRRRLG